MTTKQGCPREAPINEVALTDDEVKEIHKQFITIAWSPTDHVRYMAVTSVIEKMEREMKKRGLTP